MPRVRDDESYAVKRAAILDIAEQLVITKGYERLSINEVIAEAGMSKGAFYHYYPSKRDILTALLQRRLDHWDAQLAPIAEHDGPASQQLQEFLRVLAGAKADDREFLIKVVRGVYAEENAVLYTATREGLADRMLPRLTKIITAGREDGSFVLDDPESTARVVLSLLQECTDQISRMLIKIADGVGTGRAIERRTAAYVEVVHRALGAQPGTLDFISTTELRRWTRAARRAARSPDQEVA